MRGPNNKDYSILAREKDLKVNEINNYHSNLDNQEKTREQNTEIYQTIKSNLEDNKTRFKNNQNTYLKKMDRLEELKKNILKNNKIIKEETRKLSKLVPILIFIILITAAVFSY
tara:strand:- start:111 stop:452 length:342 start_codon:yes stop_codon:yes gene_type:complete